MELGTIIQIKPEYTTACFRRCLLIVDKILSNGVRGYQLVPNQANRQSSIYLIVKNEDYEVVGKAIHWE